MFDECTAEFQDFISQHRIHKRWRSGPLDVPTSDFSFMFLALVTIIITNREIIIIIIIIIIKLVQYSSQTIRHSHITLVQRHKPHTAVALLSQQRTAYKPAPTDVDLQPNSHTQTSSAIGWSPPYNPCNYMDYYSFADPGEWKAELAWLADP